MCCHWPWWPWWKYRRKAQIEEKKENDATWTIFVYWISGTKKKRMHRKKLMNIIIIAGVCALRMCVCVHVDVKTKWCYYAAAVDDDGRTCICSHTNPHKNHIQWHCCVAVSVRMSVCGCVWECMLPTTNLNKSFFVQFFLWCGFSLSFFLPT